MKTNTCQPTLLYPAKLSFKIDEEIVTFQDKHKRRHSHIKQKEKRSTNQIHSIKPTLPWSQNWIRIQQQQKKENYMPTSLMDIDTKEKKNLNTILKTQTQEIH